MSEVSQCIALYGDILYCKNHKSKNRRWMSNEKRAAQFAPFDALSGYKESVIETARITSQKVSLSTSHIQKINALLSKIHNQYPKRYKCSIVHFVPDTYKSGGSYQSDEVIIRQVDYANQKLILQDYKTISFDNIFRIEGGQENE